MSRNIAPESFTCGATAGNLASARGFLRRFLTTANWKGGDRDVLIAVGEVLQNIVRHGFRGGDPRGSIHLEVAMEQGVLLVFIEDNAPPSLPSGWSMSDRPAEDGGFGLDIIHHIATEVEFAPTATGNRARLAFHPA
jgi:anti-sigma regulatory factor (Ser/Thr protein kinase)